MKLSTVKERKEYLLKNTDKLLFSYNGILLNIGEYKYIDIWIGNEKCLADGGDKKLIYIRLKSADFSVPLISERICYIEKPKKEIIELAKGGFTRPLSELDKVLELTKKFKLNENKY